MVSVVADQVQGPAWWSRLGIRPDEPRMAFWISAMFAVTQSTHAFGANAADALFFLRFGVEELPVMIIWSGVAVMLVVLVHVAGLAVNGSKGWLWLVTALGAGWVALEWASISLDNRAVYPVIWISTQALIMLTYTVMWNAAEEACTTGQAKRLFPIFATAGVAGAVIGNLLTGPLASFIGTENLLLVQGVLLLASALLLRKTAIFFGDEDRGDQRPSVRAEFNAALRTVRSSRLLKLAALAGFALSTLFFLVVFPFNEAVAASFESEAEVASFLGLFSSLATAGTFMVSLFVTNRLFSRLGIVVSLMLVPVVYAAGFAAWLVGFGLASAAVVRGLQWIAVNAIGGTAYTALFNVVSGRRRGQVMAFMTAIPWQIGTVAAGVVLLVGAGLPMSGRFGLGLALALLALLVVVAMRPAYLAAIVSSVEKGLPGVFDVPHPGVVTAIDGDVDRVLAASLGDPRPEARVIAATTLSRLGGSGQPTRIQSLLQDESPLVRSAAFDSLNSLDPGYVRDHISQLILDESPGMRVRALRYLASSTDEDLPDGAIEALSDPDPRVRAAAAVLIGGDIGAATFQSALATGSEDAIAAVLDEVGRSGVALGVDPSRYLEHGGRRVRAAAVEAHSLLHPDDPAPLVGRLEDRSVDVRRRAAIALAVSATGRSALLEILETGSVIATEAALRALTPVERFVPQFTDWAASEARRAALLASYHSAVAAPETTAVRRLLVWTLSRRSIRLINWVILAMTTTETAGIMPIVERGIRSVDVETRSQAIEALETMGAHTVLAVLTPLLERGGPGRSLQERDALRMLSTDFDPWLRALSIKCLAEVIEADLAHLQTVAAEDRSDLVRSVVPSFAQMTVDHPDVLTVMDRVVALHRVPMFADLDPEDLELLATATGEVRYAPGERIYVEGDEGSEMLVIVAGEAVVSTHQGDRREVLRVLGPGEHVGELALLAEEHRTADVDAGDEGVHALVVTKVDLMSCLEERPGVALGMLRTLAIRLAVTTREGASTGPNDPAK